MVGERKVDVIEKAQGGEGIVRIEHLIPDEQKKSGCGLFAEVTIEVGAFLGCHTHTGNTETYYIQQGTGIYYDNGRSYEVKPGDVLFCEDGGNHGLKNTGDVEIKFIALIQK